MKSLPPSHNYLDYSNHFFIVYYNKIITESGTDQDCRVLHGDAGGRGPQGSAHSVVVLETDLSFSC